MARPPLDDRSHRCHQLIARAGGSKRRIQETEVVVVEIELGAAVWVRWVDPLAAGEEPVSSVAASIARMVEISIDVLLHCLNAHAR